MDQSFGDIIASPGLGPVIIISIVTIPLTAIATILRLVATKRSGRKLAWDDLFAVLALVGHLGYTVTPAAGEFLSHQRLASFSLECLEVG